MNDPALAERDSILLNGANTGDGARGGAGLGSSGYENNPADSKGGARGRKGYRYAVMTTEVLLDDERAAERPAYLFMYEQSAMRSLSEPLVQEAQRPQPRGRGLLPTRGGGDADEDPARQLAERAPLQRDAGHHAYLQEPLGMACVPLMDEIVPYLLKAYPPLQPRPA